MNAPKLSPASATTSRRPSDRAAMALIVLGGLGGAATGMLAGALAFDFSLVMALVGGLGGGLAGVLGPARAAEGL
jgi:hypothetical protein